MDTLSLSPHILIIDDDLEIRELLRDFLQRRGLIISVSPDGDDLMSMIREMQLDLIVLDLMLPGKSGLELCRDLRRVSRIPIIMLTAVADTSDRIVGLELGADDYVAKPFEPHELLARIRAVLRRRDTTDSAFTPIAPIVHQFAGWTMDITRRRVADPGGVRVEFTRAEFTLLQAFVESSGRVLSREYLLDRCGGDPSLSFDRSVDILVSRLRRKLDDDPKSPALIQTVRGDGYQFVADVRTS